MSLQCCYRVVSTTCCSHNIFKMLIKHSFLIFFRWFPFDFFFNPPPHSHCIYLKRVSLWLIVAILIWSKLQPFLVINKLYNKQIKYIYIATWSIFWWWVGCLGHSRTLKLSSKTFFLKVRLAWGKTGKVT